MLVIPTKALLVIPAKTLLVIPAQAGMTSKIRTSLSFVEVKPARA